MGQRKEKKCLKHKKHLQSPFLKTREMGTSMVSMRNQRGFSLDEEGSGQGEFCKIMLGKWIEGNETHGVTWEHQTIDVKTFV